MKYLIFIILISLLLAFWSIFVEPNILTVKKIKLSQPNLKGFKIVFASDFHFKPYEKCRLNKIVNAINNQNPDLILLGGDFVNGHKKGFTMPIQDISKGFENLQSTYGTVAILGNHDNWQGRDEIVQALDNSNIKVLENENVTVADKVTIAGLEDLQTQKPDIEKALGNIKNIPVIMLTHTPDMFPKVPDNVFLTLAGHTHGGQIVLFKPIIVPSEFGSKYAYGLIKENGKALFTTRGLGTSILPLRFNCFPEIVVIEFE